MYPKISVFNADLLLGGVAPMQPWPSTPELASDGAFIFSNTA